MLLSASTCQCSSRCKLTDFILTATSEASALIIPILQMRTPAGLSSLYEAAQLGSESIEIWTVWHHSEGSFPANTLECRSLSLSGCWVPWGDLQSLDLYEGRTVSWVQGIQGE